MLVVGDLDDVFLPSPTDLLCNLTEARAGIESLVSRLNDMFKDTSNVGNALGAGLQAAFKLVVRVDLSCVYPSLLRSPLHSPTSEARSSVFLPVCLLWVPVRSKAETIPSYSAHPRSERQQSAACVDLI